MPVTRRGATYYTVTELAERSGIPRNTLIYWINQGRVEAKRKGAAEKSPFIIPQEEAERIITEYAEGGELA
jgi:transposase-like protein